MSDEVLFKRAEKVIKSHKLNLRSDMSRKLLDKYVHIPKNKFATVFREQSGFSFPSYINDMRLDHAASMLLSHPSHTIESVAIDCGLPIQQTFYRLFKAKFGMTPTEFRAANL